jgi:uncharacterized protein YbjT (DUF2867 family)
MPNSNQLILVTGATGHQGKAVLHHLRKHRFATRVLTRNPEKPGARQIAEQGIEVVRGDLSDSASIDQALKGVSGVYSVQDSKQGPEVEIRMGNNLTDAAVRAGVRHLVYSSVGSADRHTGIPHFDSKAAIEDHLRASGVPYTVVRPTFFMENWFGLQGMIEGGAIQWALKPETSLQMIAVDDIGAFVGMAFANPEKWQGRAIDLAGDDLTMTAIAEEFSRVAGHPVAYRQIPWDAFQQVAGDEMTTMFRWFESTGYSVDIGALRKEYPALSDFPHWLNEHWRKGSAPGRQ